MAFAFIFVFGSFLLIKAQKALLLARYEPIGALWIRLFAIWFPELRAFPSNQAAMRSWLWQLEDSGRLWVPMTFGPIVLSVIVFATFLAPIPLWVLLSPFYLPLAVTMSLVRQREEIRYGLRRDLYVEHGARHCACGYDLRTIESGRCPECGEALIPGAVP
ncbi:MAG TPA: zinc ribbon domain-containing protein [Phycisphaerae bacterium]|nr:zinc ribbon domain-containing protein [Phycisphaerae bacterium]